MTEEQLQALIDYIDARIAEELAMREDGGEWSGSLTDKRREALEKLKGVMVHSPLTTMH